jgi:hypothetical protein
MEEFYFTVKLDEDRTLCLAPLTDRNLEISGQEISDSSGYFLYEKHHSDGMPRVEIIAQVVSEDAVFRLREMLRMS